MILLAHVFCIARFPAAIHRRVTLVDTLSRSTRAGRLHFTQVRRLAHEYLASQARDGKGDKVRRPPPLQGGALPRFDWGILNLSSLRPDCAQAPKGFVIK